MSNEEQKPTLQQTDVVRSFLEEMAKKHQCPIDLVTVGIVLNELHVWRYDEDANEEWKQWKQLEIVSL